MGRSIESGEAGPAELRCWRLVSQSDRCGIGDRVELVIERAEPWPPMEVRCNFE